MERLGGLNKAVHGARSYLTRDLDKTFILATVFLVIFVKFWEPGIGIMSATYGALAKNMLADHQWFRPHLGPGIYDPFVEHPYLVLWLDALVFRLFGISAQTLRIVSSFFGLAVFASLYAVLKKRFGLNTACFGCLMLLTGNVFMNFANSGWLDMPMIGLVWLGFAALELGHSAEHSFGPSFVQEANLAASKTDIDQSSESQTGRTPLVPGGLGFLLSPAIGGVFLGLSVLAKGASAIAVMPILFWYLVTEVSWKKRGLATLSFLAPIALFTFAHYQSEGFLFWKSYYLRQAVALNDVSQQYRSLSDLTWYLRGIFKFGPFLTVIGLYGCYRLFRSRRRLDLAWLILLELGIHIAFYAHSSRHFIQYVIPVYPWFALSAAVALTMWFPKIQPRQLSKGAFGLAVTVFIALDLFPLRIHSGNDNAYRPMTATVDRVSATDKVFFLADMADQKMWERHGTCISWFWNRTPIISNMKEMLAKLTADGSNEIGLVPKARVTEEILRTLAQEPRIKLCLENQDLLIYTNRGICQEPVLRERITDPPKQTFNR